MAHEQIGGQALLEGVMMRRGEVWGAAVRNLDGSISSTQRQLPSGLARWRSVPLIRGVLAIGESAALGSKAMVWAANTRNGDTESDNRGFSKVGLALSTVIAAALALGIFGLLPAVIVKLVGVDSPTLFSVSEGLIRLAILVGYMWLLSLSPQVRRVFGYHGAEHMTIHAFEHGLNLDPISVKNFNRRHPRCGTSFLLLVVMVTIVAHIIIGNPSWPVLVASRILGLPIVAGISYEVVRYAGRHQTSLLGRALMAPGYWLQTLTTREPDDAMIEVAIEALIATESASKVNTSELMGVNA